MKKALALISLMIIVAQLIGHECAFLLAKNHAKNLMTENINSIKSSALIEKIPTRQIIHWEEDGKEFELNGKMYDVIGFDTQKQVYLCINDDKETDILSYYQHWIQSQHGSKDQKKSALAALKWYSIECTVDIIDKINFNLLVNTSSIFQSKYHSIDFYKMLKAPPKAVC